MNNTILSGNFIPSISYKTPEDNQYTNTFFSQLNNDQQFLVYTLAYILSNRESLQASATLAKLREAHYATQIQHDDFKRKPNDEVSSLRSVLKDNLPGLVGLDEIQLRDVAKQIKFSNFNKLGNDGVTAEATLTLMAHGAKAGELSPSLFARRLLAFLHHCDAWEANIATLKGEALQELLRQKTHEMFVKTFQHGQVKSELLPYLINSEPNIIAASDTSISPSAASEDISLNPLNHRTIPLFGRAKERQQLNTFLDADAPFQLCFMIGPSGAGKTRLTTQWYRELEADAAYLHWQRGFIEQEQHQLDHQVTWSQWKEEALTNDTLIIVDYIYRFDDIIRLICDKGHDLAREHDKAIKERLAKESHNLMSLGLDGHQSTTHLKTQIEAPCKLRLLILDHRLPDLSHLSEFQRSALGDESRASNYQFSESPIYLDPLSRATEANHDPQAHQAMMHQIIAAAYQPDAQLAIDSTTKLTHIHNAYQHLAGLSLANAPTTPTSTDTTAHQHSFANYPLFGILMGQAMSEQINSTLIADNDGYQPSDVLLSFDALHLSRRKLIEYHFKRDNKRRLVWESLGEQTTSVLAETELRQLAAVAVCAATVVQELPFTTIYHQCLSVFFEASERDTLDPQRIEAQFYDLCVNITSSQDDVNTLTRYQPDIIGETFLLAFVARFNNLYKTTSQRLLPLLHGLIAQHITASAHQTTPSVHRGTIEFAARCSRNLLNDSPELIHQQNYQQAFLSLLAPNTYQPTLTTEASTITSFDPVALTLSLANAAALNEVYQHISKRYSGQSLVEAEPIATEHQWITALIAQIDIHLLTACCLSEQKKEEAGWDSLFAQCLEALSLIVECKLLISSTPAALPAWYREFVICYCQQSTAPKTVLFIPCYFDHELLLHQTQQEFEENIDHQDNKGWTVLTIATHRNSVRCVQYLQDIADINLQENDGWTALMVASRYGHTEIVKQLLSRDKVDINLQKDGSWTALMLACHNGHTEIVEQLLSRDKVDTNLQSNNGWTGLMQASRYGHTEIVEQLLDRDDVDTNLQENNGWTALMMASRYGHTEIVKQLLSRDKVDTNLQSNDGWTALMAASSYGHTEIVEQLLSRDKVDTNLQMNNDKTAFDISLTNQQFYIAKRLLTHHQVISTCKKLGILWTDLPEFNDDLAQLPRKLLSPLKAQKILFILPAFAGLTFTYLKEPETAALLHALQANELDILVHTHLRAVREYQAPFYADAKIYELIYWVDNEQKTTFSNYQSAILVLTQNQYHWLSGIAPTIHTLNKECLISLKSSPTEVVMSYLKFFCESIYVSDKSMFVLPTSYDDLKLRLHTAPTKNNSWKDDIAALWQDPTCEQQNDGWSIKNQIVMYGDALFSCVFTVFHDGRVGMIDDTELVENLPCAIETYEFGLRVFKKANNEGEPKFLVEDTSEAIET